MSLIEMLLHDVVSAVSDRRRTNRTAPAGLPCLPPDNVSCRVVFVPQGEVDVPGLDASAPEVRDPQVRWRARDIVVVRETHKCGRGRG